MAYYLAKDELYHHGILGQKWGIRRYQNPDGTYTAEGKARRYKQYVKGFNKKKRVFEIGKDIYENLDSSTKKELSKLHFLTKLTEDNADSFLWGYMKKYVPNEHDGGELDYKDLSWYKKATKKELADVYYAQQEHTIYSKKYDDKLWDITGKLEKDSGLDKSYRTYDARKDLIGEIKYFVEKNNNDIYKVRTAKDNLNRAEWMLNQKRKNTKHSKKYYSDKSLTELKKNVEIKKKEYDKIRSYVKKKYNYDL